MKTRNQVLSVGIAVVAIALVLLLVQNFAAPALTTTGLTDFAGPASAPTVLPADAIPLKPVVGFR